MFTGIAGHKKQIDRLTKSIETGKVAHAYVFSGPSFVGKQTIAKKFALRLLGDSNNFHPDFLEVSGEDGIKIEQIRELVYKLSLQPYQAKYKVALIDNAESMTLEAQNALLKTLEEPKSYTVLILVTANPGKLLRTIMSRAQKINFGPVATDDYKDLIEVKTSKEAKDLILDFASGRPGLAKSIAADESLVEKLSQINSDYEIVAGEQLPEKLKLAYDLAGLETVDLKQVLDFWLIKFEHQLLQKPDIASARNVSEVSQARRYMDQNVNSKLLLTNLMLNLS
jgi:DNA polymerase-3 subunit delta'